MCAYLRAKFEVSTIILSSFRHEVISPPCFPTPPPPPLTPPPYTHTSKRTPKNPTHIRVKPDQLINQYNKRKITPIKYF